MKKTGLIIALTVFFVITILTAGCVNTGVAASSQQTSPQTSQQTIPTATPDMSGDINDVGRAGEVSSGSTGSNGKNVLVIYFSRTGEQYGVGVIGKGNTAIVADMIKEATGAESYEILPETDYYPYTYNELTDIAKKEQSENARPAYKKNVPDLSKYDTVFIGAPVWWGDWPMICYTFFEENSESLAGKTLIPFCTHAGSGLSGLDGKLSSALPKSNVGKGLAIYGSDAQKNSDTAKTEVNDWLSQVLNTETS